MFPSHDQGPISRRGASQGERTMNIWFVLIYFICFAIIAGAAFAMMWGNIQSLNNSMKSSPTPRHPEAPAPGTEVMYVDVSSMNSEDFNKTKQSLEDLYND